MGQAGKIFPQYTVIEISEDGAIWLIQNYFESESVILEMESTAKGFVITSDLEFDEYHEDILFGEDYT